MKLQTQCVSRKVMKFCSLQPFHLMLLRVLKNNLYLTRYNMRRKETEHGHMWLCSVVAREASHEARSRGFRSHGARNVAILREKCQVVG
jgi:hypothetical protein